MEEGRGERAQNHEIDKKERERESTTKRPMRGERERERKTKGQMKGEREREPN